MRIVNSLGLCLGLLMAGQALGGFVSVSGNGAIKIAPSGLDQVLNTVEQNSQQWGFQETYKGAVFATNLSVDGTASNLIANAQTILSSGGFVNSYMIFLNRNAAGALTNATWTFDEKILGVISDVDGLLESKSTGLLGHDKVLYPKSSSDTSGLLGGNGTGNYLTNTSPSSFQNRGLEGNSVVKSSLSNFNSANSDAYYISGKMLYLKSDVSQPGDWVRVITEASSLGSGAVVPEPTTMALWGLGVAGIGFISRRRK